MCATFLKLLFIMYLPIKNVKSICMFQHRMKDTDFLTFEAITLVPMQQKMLLPDLLTEEEVN